MNRRSDMIGSDLAKEPSLEKVVNRISRDPFLREDLMQEATVHFWKMEREHPGKTLSWYLQSCAFHLRHYLASGRSVDSPKRRAFRVDMAEEQELSETLKADNGVIREVEFCEILHELSRSLTPREQAILRYLADGLGPREIACRLNFSHPVAIKCRRRIAALAVRMGIASAPAAPRDARARPSNRKSGLMQEKPASPADSLPETRPRAQNGNGEPSQPD